MSDAPITKTCTGGKFCTLNWGHDGPCVAQRRADPAGTRYPVRYLDEDDDSWRPAKYTRDKYTREAWERSK